MTGQTDGNHWMNWMKNRDLTETFLVHSNSYKT
jgi:hypothetical protein